MDQGDTRLISTTCMVKSSAGSCGLHRFRTPFRLERSARAAGFLTGPDPDVVMTTVVTARTPQWCDVCHRVVGSEWCDMCHSQADAFAPGIVPGRVSRVRIDPWKVSNRVCPWRRMTGLRDALRPWKYPREAPQGDQSVSASVD